MFTHFYVTNNRTQYPKDDSDDNCDSNDDDVNVEKIKQTN